MLTALHMPATLILSDTLLEISCTINCLSSSRTIVDLFYRNDRDISKQWHGYTFFLQSRWKLFGISLESLWNLFGISLESHCNLYGISLVNEECVGVLFVVRWIYHHMGLNLDPVDGYAAGKVSGQHRACREEVQIYRTWKWSHMDLPMS